VRGVPVDASLRTPFLNDAMLDLTYPYPIPFATPTTARGATDKAEAAMDKGVSKAKGLFGSLKDMLK